MYSIREDQAVIDEEESTSEFGLYPSEAENGEQIAQQSDAESSRGSLRSSYGRKVSWEDDNENEENGNNNAHSAHTPYSAKLHDECTAADLKLENLKECLQCNPGDAFVQSPAHFNLFPVNLLLREHFSKMLEDTGLFDFCFELICTNPEALLLEKEGDMGRLVFLEPIHSWIAAEKNIRRSSFVPRPSMRNLNNSHGRHGAIGEFFGNNKADTRLVDVELSENAELVLRMLSALIDDETKGALEERGIRRRRKIQSVDEVVNIIIVKLLQSIPGFLRKSLLINDVKVGDIFELSVMKRILLQPEAHSKKWLLKFVEQRSDRMNIYLEALSKLLSPDVGGLIKEDEEDGWVKRRSGPGNFFQKAASYFNIFDNVGVDTEINGPTDLAVLMSKKRDTLIEHLSNKLRILSFIGRMDSSYQLQAASTRVIQVIVDNETSRPFITCLTVLDLIFHTVLFVASQVQRIFYLQREGVETFIVASQVTLFSLFYFITREMIQLVSQRKVRDFNKYILLDPWNLVDLASLILLLSSSIMMDKDFGERFFEMDNSGDNDYAAGASSTDSTGRFEFSSDYDYAVLSRQSMRLIVFATYMGSFFLFHFIRVLNQSLAVLIYSLIHVIGDLKWFMFVMFLLLSMSAQLFMAIIPGSTYVKQYCPMPAEHSDVFTISRAIQNFSCADMTHFAYFIRRCFQMMLGDYKHEADALAYTDTSYISYVLFSFVITVVMLNMLIAIVSDAYKDALLKGPGLFRTMRLNYCAEVTLMERAMLDTKRLIIMLVLSVTLVAFVTQEVVSFTLESLDELGVDDTARYTTDIYVSIAVMSVFVSFAYGILLYTASANHGSVSWFVETEEEESYHTGVTHTEYRSSIGGANKSRNILRRIFNKILELVSAFFTLVGYLVIGTVEESQENKDNEVTLPADVKMVSIDLKQDGRRVITYTTEF